MRVFHIDSPAYGDRYNSYHTCVRQRRKSSQIVHCECVLFSMVTIGMSPLLIYPLSPSKVRDCY